MNATSLLSMMSQACSLFYLQASERQSGIWSCKMPGLHACTHIHLGHTTNVDSVCVCVCVSVCVCVCVCMCVRALWKKITERIGQIGS